VQRVAQLVGHRKRGQALVGQRGERLAQPLCLVRLLLERRFARTLDDVVVGGVTSQGGAGGWVS
jgi:hypothetical protein